MTGPDMFTCAHCGVAFVKARTDAEAWDEALDLYPAEQLAAGVDAVCDDCFTVVTAWARADAPELFRERP